MKERCGEDLSLHSLLCLNAESRDEESESESEYKDVSERVRE